MNASVKKFIRTVQTSFPFLLDLKFAAMRKYRKLRGIPFERDFEALTLFSAPKDALYLDIGANRGQSTEAILMKTSSGPIQQFEPNPLLCEKLTGLYGSNPRVTTNSFGLADVASDRTLYVPFYKNWMFDGLASFDASHAGSWLKGRVYFYKDEHVKLRETKCRIRRLDEFNLKPFFMKLDIQGYEFLALKGGEQTIKSNEPILLIESPPEDDIVNYLKGFGYVMYAFRDGKFFPGQAGSHNTFFMTPAKAVLVKAHIQ
jgi:FkbM family methyltransferase